MTERELKSKLEAKMLELGADGPSFDTIVASGYRGALPHVSSTILAAYLIFSISSGVFISLIFSISFPIEINL
jgi:Xaa-Pro aminopeptidase